MRSAHPAGLALFAALLSLGGVPAAGLREGLDIRLPGPNGRLVINLTVSEAGSVGWHAALDKRPVILHSPLGIVVDGVNLGEGVRAGVKEDRYSINGRYAWRGVHSQAVNRANGVRLSLTHHASKTPYVVDVRAFDDAVAFRHVIPGTGRRVPDAATSFRLPKGTLVWYHGLRDHYEALYERRAIEEIKDGEWAAPPVTFKLPDGARLRIDHRSRSARLRRHGAAGRRRRGISRAARAQASAQLSLHASVRR